MLRKKKREREQKTASESLLERDQKSMIESAEKEGMKPSLISKHF